MKSTTLYMGLEGMSRREVRREISEIRDRKQPMVSRSATSNTQPSRAGAPKHRLALPDEQNFYMKGSRGKFLVEQR